MSELDIGSAAPHINLPVDSKSGDALNSESIDHPYVLYFYPKDDTPGCTKEAIAFTEHKADFEALGVKVYGVSKDTVAKHDKFIDKHDLDLTLISDEEGAACEAYGVWVEKSMYGKTYMGIERATYLIGKDGKIAQKWRKVKVKGHVEAVLEEAKKLSA